MVIASQLASSESVFADTIVHLLSNLLSNAAIMIVEAIYSYVYDSRFIFQLLATLTVYNGIKIVHFYRRRQKRYKLFEYYGIPGPEHSLVDGVLGELKRRHKDDRMIFKTEEEWSRKYGKVYGYFLGDIPTVIVTDLEIIRAIFLNENKCFTERCVLFMDGPLNDGILFTKYPRWKFMRKVMSPSFSRYNMRGVQSSQFIENSIKLMLDYIDNKSEEAQSRGIEPSIDMQDLMKSTALNLISEIALKLPNIQVHENDETVRQLDSYLCQADQGAVTLILRFPFLKPLFQFISDHYEHNSALGLIKKTLNAKIDEGLQNLADGSRVSEQQMQIIDTMIKLHYEGSMSRAEIVGTAFALLFAGYDTTSTLLTYVFWVLAKHQDCQDKLRAELIAHGIESKYLMMVLSETMRLYPSVMKFTTRLATSNYHIDNLTIPQGTRVLYHNWLMHHSPELWPNPDKFEPERFREGSKMHPCAFAPFGLGERKCLGYQLANLELKMITCDILLRYKLKIISPENLEIRTYASDLTKPKEKIVLKLEKL